MEQVEVMNWLWPQLRMVQRHDGCVIWRGPLVGIERPYIISIAYKVPDEAQPVSLARRFPLVRVVSPQLRPNFRAAEEAPLPHVFFDRDDLTKSVLCLFDPEDHQWSHDDLIAHTTVPWTAEWLACYEGWLATGHWYGGGRHPSKRDARRVRRS